MTYQAEKEGENGWGANGKGHCSVLIMYKTRSWQQTYSLKSAGSGFVLVLLRTHPKYTYNIKKTERSVDFKRLKQRNLCSKRSKFEQANSSSLDSEVKSLQSRHHLAVQLL
eukprot:6480356-Amphidinium_carterae.1